MRHGTRGVTMAKKPIEELVDILKGHIDDKNLSGGSDRLHITVTTEVDIIIEMFGPLYEVWIQNHEEGEGCTVARNEDRFRVASFILSVFSLNGVKK